MRLISRVVCSLMVMFSAVASHADTCGPPAHCDARIQHSACYCNSGTCITFCENNRNFGVLTLPTDKGWKLESRESVAQSASAPAKMPVSKKPAASASASQ